MAVPSGYDFSGYISKYGVICDDGLIIRKGAFTNDDGRQVSLVYNHDHKNISNILGHSILEDRDDGMYAYCYLNNGENANHAREVLKHKDLASLSVWANGLVRSGKDILHGMVREVSLCIDGADPKAKIESVMVHGVTIDEDEDEGYIYPGELIGGDYIEHAAKDDEEETEGGKKVNNKGDNGGSNKTVEEIFEAMTDEQKAAVAAIVGQAIEDAQGDSDDEEDDDEEEEEEVKHNAFDNGNDVRVITKEDYNQIFSDAKRMGSLRDAVNNNIEEGGVLAHSIDSDGMVGPSSSTASQTYGFRDPDMLFPDYKSLNTPPDWISRNMDWVSVLMGSVSHTPFSRIKSVFADITEDDARARGYIKAKQKKEEIFTLLKRTTDPQTIYKKQKLDKDDISDITDFDVVAWIRAEMRTMLNEEIARAVLIGDGRLTSSDDKISEDHIRPIVNDVPLFNIQHAVNVGSTDDDDKVAKNIIREAVKARKDYKGSGNPIFFTTEDYLTNMLLLEDTMGHRMYKTEQELATAMRVSRIVTVEVMEGAKVNVKVTSGNTTTTVTKDLIGVIINPKDYNIGADKGGAVSMFDDFDIDYNQQKYLIETRISGALVKPYSAITLYKDATTQSTGD